MRKILGELGSKERHTFQAKCIIFCGKLNKGLKKAQVR